MRLVRMVAWSPVFALVVSLAAIAVATVVAPVVIPSGFVRQAAIFVWLVPGMAYFAATLRHRRVAFAEPPTKWHHDPDWAPSGCVVPSPASGAKEPRTAESRDGA